MQVYFIRRSLYIKIPYFLLISLISLMKMLYWKITKWREFVLRYQNILFTDFNTLLFSLQYTSSVYNIYNYIHEKLYEHLLIVLNAYCQCHYISRKR